MKQDINLLDASSASARRLSAKHAAGGVTVVVAIAIAAGLLLDRRLHNLEQQIAAANAASDELVLNLEQRSEFLARRNADPKLVEELLGREREADDKAQVLGLLSGEALGNTEGFSDHLAALARRHPQGLWLQHIRVAAGGRGLLLQGRTLAPDLVPKFLEELRMEPSFQGTAFASFTMEGDAVSGEPLRFTLATLCEDPLGGEGAPGCPADEETPR